MSVAIVAGAPPGHRRGLGRRRASETICGHCRGAIVAVIVAAVVGAIVDAIVGAIVGAIVAAIVGAVVDDHFLIVTL